MTLEEAIDPASSYTTTISFTPSASTVSSDRSCESWFQEAGGGPDNSLAVQMLNGLTKKKQKPGLVDRILKRCGQDLEVKFRHVHRDLNMVADFLTKHVLARSYNLQVFEEPPAHELRMLLWKDAQSLE